MWTMFPLLRSRLRGRLTDMPLDRAIAEEYLARVQAGDWSCVALLSCVATVQQYRPELSQTQAITRAMTIIKRVRDQGIG
jgi:hypothetical protein